MQNLSNTSLGQYQLIEVIGRGRMSTVYKAYQPSLRRFVAIKVLQHLDLLGATRFEREAQVIAQLHHPNILPIFDYGQQNGLRYFVTQYIEASVTLSDMFAQKPIDHIAALDLMKHLLAGLAYAHSHGIIHRDIKPSNILLPSPAWPLLADFGIAKLLADRRQLTPPGQTVGTVAYMAPELARGLPADARSDLYSVGIVLYELLTGQAPFDAVTPSAVLNLHIHAAPPRPRTLNRELPIEVERLLLRALEKDQAARYQSASDMAADLEHVASRLKRERTLAELLNPPTHSSIAPIYTTRKLDPDPQLVEEPERNAGDVQAAQSHARPNASGAGRSHATAVPQSNRLRDVWGIGLVFIVVVVASLIGGMLAAYLLRSRFAEGHQLPGATTQINQTASPAASQKQDMRAGATVFPADIPGSEDAGVPSSATGSLVPTTGLASSAPVSSTAASVDAAAPTLQLPLMDTLPPVLEPSAVLMPAPSIEPPTASGAPTPLPEIATAPSY